jgi:hypothetical protein
MEPSGARIQLFTQSKWATLPSTLNEPSLIRTLAAWAVAGVVATLTMDVLGGVLRSTGLTHGAPPQLIGRFFFSVFRGHVASLDPALPADAPIPLGLILPIHYAIGVSLAVAFGLLARALFAPVPLWAPVVFGFLTTALPALWMFPAMGFGVGGVNAPVELLLLRTAVVNHAFFGVGLALATRFVVPAIAGR